MRNLARDRLKTDFLRRWWCKKYVAPPTDPRYLAYTPEELWVEYLEDIYERNPAALREFDVQEDTVLQTGDKEIDEIERRLAEGEDPDEVLAGWGNSSPKAPDGLVESEDIEDDYTESSDAAPEDAFTPRPTKWTPTRP